MTKETAMKILKELHGKSLFAERTALETLIPELADSKDEKIRNALIRFHKSTIDVDGIKGADILSWLEKQGDKDTFSVPTKETIISIWELGNDWKDITHGSISTKYGTQLEYIQKHWQESEYYLEKQGKKKDFAPKQEPKFKVGDWISNGRYTKLIVGINSDWPHYMFNDGTSERIKYIDKKYHLWAIQDAKKGDVLAAQECYVIFKEIDGLNIRCHCTYHYMGFNPSFYINTLQNKTAFQPATKEQYDLLFQKMKESGYEWDADKKELKKLTQSVTKKSDQATWSYEDDYNLQCMVAKVTYDIQKGNVGRNNELIDWLKSLKNRVQPQPKEWSDEDENLSYWTIQNLTELKNRFGEKYGNCNKCINWLKSLKDRITWKPSEEQMETLEYYMHTLLATEHKEVLFGLYNDLKKL